MTDQATGSTLLTEDLPAGGGNPAEGANAQTPLANTNEPAKPNGAAPAERPEYIPEKFWKDGKPDVENLGKSYVNLEKLLGSDKVPLPKSDDDKDGWERVYAALGRPEASDKYEIAKPEVPQGLQVEYSEEEEKFWRDLAHQNGLSQRQFANMWDVGVKARLERAISWHNDQGQAREKAAEALKREWGHSFDGNVVAAKTALKQFADPDFMQYLDETGLGNDPRMTRVWNKVGKALVGDGKLRGDPPRDPGPADLDRQIGEYRSKYQKELFDKSHPNHEFHTREYTRLFQLRYPDGQ